MLWEIKYKNRDMLGRAGIAFPAYVFVIALLIKPVIARVPPKIPAFVGNGHGWRRHIRGVVEPF